MTNAQMFALFGSIVALFSAQTTILVLFINAKVNPIASDVKMLVQYMVSHEGKIIRVETKLGIKGDEKP